MDGIKQFFSTVWEYWKKIGRFIGDILGRAVLMLFYITIVLPFGVGASLFGDALDTRKKDGLPTWKERTSPEATIEASYNQF